MPAEPAREWLTPSLSAYGIVSSHWRRRKCLSLFRHHAVAVSDHRWCSAGSIGSVPNGGRGQLRRMDADGLLRHVVYLDEREDKLAIDVRRDPAKSGNQNE